MVVPSSKITLSDGVHFNNQSEGAVLLHVTSGLYYGLNPVGAAMLEAVLTHGSPHAALPALMELFIDADAERVEQDLLTLAGQLAAEGLIHCEG